MNKKTYIAPQAVFIQIKSEGMLAASGEVSISNDPNDMESGGNSLSDKRGSWNSELWANWCHVSCFPRSPQSQVKCVERTVFEVILTQVLLIICSFIQEVASMCHLFLWCSFHQTLHWILHTFYIRLYTKLNTVFQHKSLINSTLCFQHVSDGTNDTDCSELFVKNPTILSHFSAIRH